MFIGVRPICFQCVTLVSVLPSEPDSQDTTLTASPKTFYSYLIRFAESWTVSCYGVAEKGRDGDKGPSLPPTLSAACTCCNGRETQEFAVIPDIFPIVVPFHALNAPAAKRTLPLAELIATLVRNVCCLTASHQPTSFVQHVAEPFSECLAVKVSAVCALQSCHCSLQGIDVSRPEIKSELEAVSVGDMVDMDVLLAHPESICCKAMTGNLAMKDWAGFTSTMCVLSLLMGAAQLAAPHTSC